MASGWATFSYLDKTIIITYKIEFENEVTLIFNIATPRYVIQVADRRLTFLSNGEVKDDDTNKIVCFCGRMAFGYTGLAELEDKKTDIWLTNILASSGTSSLSDALETIRHTATLTFQNINIAPENKRHAFVGVGWTRLSMEEGFLPILCRVSNYYDENNQKHDRPFEEFKVKYHILFKPTDHSFMDVGASLTQTEHNKIIRLLKNATQRNASPSVIIRILTTEIRAIARRNSRVGKQLLAVYIPKSYVERTNGTEAAIFAPFTPEAPSFLYLPQNDTVRIAYGPNIVGGGWAITNFYGKNL